MKLFEAKEVEGMKLYIIGDQSLHCGNDYFNIIIADSQEEAEAIALEGGCEVPYTEGEVAIQKGCAARISGDRVDCIPVGSEWRLVTSRGIDGVTRRGMVKEA